MLKKNTSHICTETCDHTEHSHGLTDNFMVGVDSIVTELPDSESGLEKKLTVRVPAECLKILSAAVLKQVSTQPMAGFRSGRASKNTLKWVAHQQSEKIRWDAISKAMNQSLKQEIKKHNLVLATAPYQFEVLSGPTDLELRYQATVECMPENVVLSDVATFKIESPVCEIQDADIENNILQLRKKYATTTQVDRAAQLEDSVKINFIGLIDGQLFENNQGIDLTVVIGSKRYLPGFEEGLIGKSAGEKFELNLVFPENWESCQLAGQPVVFSVEVLSVSEPVLPELDEVFLNRVFSGQVETIEQLSDTIRKYLTNLSQQESQKVIRAQIDEWLLSAHPDLKIPKAFVNQELANIINQMTQSKNPNSEQVNTISRESQSADPSLDAQHTVGFENSDFSDEAMDFYRAIAAKKVRLSLIFNRIVEREKLSVSEEQIKKLLFQWYETYLFDAQSDSPSQVLNRMKHLVEPAREALLIEEAYQYLEKQVEIQKRSCGLNELLDSQIKWGFLEPNHNVAS